MLSAKNKKKSRVKSNNPGSNVKKGSKSASRHIAAEKRKSELPEKRKRQYKHILESEKKEGRPVKTAKRIAMATVNKTRRKKGETRTTKRGSAKK